MYLKDLEDATVFTFEDQPGVRFGVKHTILGVIGYWSLGQRLSFETNCEQARVIPIDLAKLWHDNAVAQRTINGYRELVEQLRTQLDETQGDSYVLRRRNQRQG